MLLNDFVKEEVHRRNLFNKNKNFDSDIMRVQDFSFFKESPSWSGDFQ